MNEEMIEQMAEMVHDLHADTIEVYEEMGEADAS
jgi:hypothetical protein